jgi:3-hydroxybutyrate dehydrogenase
MLTGKVALVTGSATGGVGLATARALAQKGCRIILQGLGDAAEIEKTRKQLASEHDVDVYSFATDLSNVDEIEALVATIQRDIGTIDILVNNAVSRNRGPIESLSREQWDRAVAVNLSAPFHLMRLTVPAMKSQRWGRIINIASNLGLQGTNDRSDYVATKHGIVGLTRAIALETVRHGVTCNAIAPGSTLTQQPEWQIVEIMEKNNMTREEATQHFLKARQPSQRFVMPEHIGELIVFLCGDAASEITGSPIAIDGGWLAGNLL